MRMSKLFFGNRAALYVEIEIYKKNILKSPYEYHKVCGNNNFNTSESYVMSKIA